METSDISKDELLILIAEVEKKIIETPQVIDESIQTLGMMCIVGVTKGNREKTLDLMMKSIMSLSQGSSRLMSLYETMKEKKDFGQGVSVEKVSSEDMIKIIFDKITKERTDDVQRETFH